MCCLLIGGLESLADNYVIEDMLLDYLQSGVAGSECRKKTALTSEWKLWHEDPPDTRLPPTPMWQDVLPMALPPLGKLLISKLSLRCALQR